MKGDKMNQEREVIRQIRAVVKEFNQDGLNSPYDAMEEIRVILNKFALLSKE